MVRIVVTGKSVTKYKASVAVVTWFFPSKLEAERFAFRLRLRYR